MSKWWYALTDDAQDALLVAAFILEAYVLFGVMI